MSADVAQPPRSPPRIAGTRIPSDERSNNSNSSSLRLSSAEHDADPHHHHHSNGSNNSNNNNSIKKSPPATTSSYLRSRRRSDECTDTGSIGYGSSAPLESETSYSSHLGYPLKQQLQQQQLHQAKSPCSDAVGSARLPAAEIRHHRCYQNQQINSPGSTSSHSSSTSTPSSGAYVDVTSSARLGSTVTNDNNSGSSRKPRNALVKSRTGALANVAPAQQQQAASTTTVSSWNNNNNGALSAEPETGYVVDSEKGNAYFKGQLLGKGGFARVYLITDIATRKQYACKIIPKHHMQKIHMQKVAREIMIHKELNHVNVVKMHHYFEDTLNVYMLLEACPKKSLVHVLKYRGKVTEPEARYYMKQMANGVAYIHSQMIIHRDLKPGNMFLSDRMIVKIGDFGLATQPDNQRVTICGTPNFIAPEVLFKQSYSYEADVWALGCILYVLLVGQPPFDSSTLKETYSRICNHRYRELDDTMASRAGQDLVRWLLQPKPELRPTLDLVKKHPYLTEEYAPATLPESCCYQAPRLPLVDRNSALSSFSSSLNFAPGQPDNQAQSQQKSQDGKKSKKKKKVSSWLASWRLPKIPRFRQRITSVLCLEARKKQQALSEAGAATNNNNNGPALPQSQLMARALEDCLAGMPKAGRPNRRNPPTVLDYSPLFVTKWIDYSNKYGLAFQLYDKSVGVLFNDSSKMSYTQDRRRVEYITADGEVTRYSNEQNVPKDLHEKLELLRHFTGYMDEKLTDGGEIAKRRADPSSADTGSRSSKAPSVPLMRRWLRTSKAIVMELSVPLLQMNFIEDHTKLIVSQAGGGAAAYLLTYIDGERRASTYWLNDLRDYGCSAELHERMLYIYKVAKEFAELDAAQAY